MSRQHIPPGEHVHHWVIETPNGDAERPGVCKCCGERRMFRSAHPLDDDTLDPRHRSKLSHEGVAMNRMEKSRRWKR